MRTLLRARDLLVRQRIDTDNAIRPALLARGVPLPPEFRRWIDRVKRSLPRRFQRCAHRWKAG
jgi:transposase